MTITSPIYVGIDVSKDTLEVAKLVRYLKQGKPKLIAEGSRLWWDGETSSMTCSKPRKIACGAAQWKSRAL